MKFIVKDITGEVYETPDVTKEQLFTELHQAYGVETDEEAGSYYRVIVNSMLDYRNMTSVTINVGTLEDIQNVQLNPDHIVSLQLLNPIKEWENENDRSTVLTDPRFITD